MATAKNVLKGWFENGDYPNQEQFWAWMDAYWHKDEPISIEAILGLEELIAGKATQADIDNINERLDAIEELITGVVVPDDVPIVISAEWAGLDYYDYPDMEGKRVRLFRNGAYFSDWQAKETGGWIMTAFGDVLEAGQIFIIQYY